MASRFGVAGVAKRIVHWISAQEHPLKTATVDALGQADGSRISSDSEDGRERTMGLEQLQL